MIPQVKAAISELRERAAAYIRLATALESLDRVESAHPAAPAHFADPAHPPAHPPAPRRKLSARGRARIVAAQRARWAKARAAEAKKAGR